MLSVFSFVTISLLLPGSSKLDYFRIGLSDLVVVLVLVLALVLGFLRLFPVGPRHGLTGMSIKSGSMSMVL